MKKITLTAVLFLSILTACGSAGSSANTNAFSKPSSERASSDTGSGSGGKMMSNSSVAQVSLNQAEQTETAPVVVERKIIRNADLQLEADKPEDAQIRISQIAETKGGFVVETQSSASDVKATTRDTVTMTVRVPAAKFDEALNEIRATASRLIQENVKGEDVTEEFIDVEARLKTQKALEAQFLEIMKQSKSVADALNVQTEIAQVRGEIEKIEGRKRFLENQSSLSTIKIRLQTPTAFSAHSSGFFYQLKEALGDGFDAALTFVLILVRIVIALLPFFLLIVLPVYFVIRYFIRKNSKQKSAGEIVREEIKTGQ